MSVTICAPNVSLREITLANRAAVEALTVTAVQAEYVAGVAESLVEAAETPDACPYFSGAAEFRALFESAFDEASFVGLESFTGSRQKIFCELSPDAQRAWLDLVEATADTAEGIGLSEHFLFVGRPRSAG